MISQLLNDHQIDTLGEKISKLHHDIMTLEMQLVDQLEVRIKVHVLCMCTYIAIYFNYF